MNPDADQMLLFEEAMQAEPLPGRREELNHLLAANPTLQAAWIAHRRLVVSFSGLAPRTDLGARVLAVAQSGRQSRCQVIAAGVQRRLEVRRWRRIGLRAMAAAAAIIIVYVAIAWPRSGVELQRVGVAGAQRIAYGTSLASDGQVVLRWRDGSLAELAPGTQVTVASDGLNLVSGVADCTILPRSREAFRITTAQAHVTVLGTRFRCTADRTSSGVEVTRGRVRMVAAGTDLELGAGDAARAITGSPPQRETVVWRWPGDEAALTAGTRQADGSVRSGVFQDRTGAIPHLNFAGLAGGRELFAWHPGQVLRVALRCADRQMHLQFLDQALGINQHLMATVVPGEWTVVTYDLDALRPYGSGPAPVAGATFGSVNFTPEPDPEGHPFDLGWIEVVQTESR